MKVTITMTDVCVVEWECKLQDEFSNGYVKFLPEFAIVNTVTCVPYHITGPVAVLFLDVVHIFRKANASVCRLIIQPPFFAVVGLLGM